MASAEQQSADDKTGAPRNGESDDGTAAETDRESASSTTGNQIEGKLPDRGGAEHLQSEVTTRSQGKGRARMGSILVRKKTSLFGLSKAGRTQSDLQAVEKARLAQSMGLEPVVVESIEKCVKMKKPDNKTYSISKHGITKVVRLFNEKPQSKPLTVCFNFPSMALTHLHILKLMRGLVSPIAGANVTG